jgi:hypothetical protein
MTDIINDLTSNDNTLTGAPTGRRSGLTSTSSDRKSFGFEKPHEGDTNNWLTPQNLLRLLGIFDLDPCGCVGMPWLHATTTYFYPEHDGLIDAWFGRVFCNPPYGPYVTDWARRMAAHGNGIMLIFARTDTTTWQRDIFPFADAILFLSGRVHFYRLFGARGESVTAPSALLAFGISNVDALRNSGIAGALCLKAEMLAGVKASEF